MGQEVLQALLSSDLWAALLARPVSALLPLSSGAYSLATGDLAAVLGHPVVAQEVGQALDQQPADAD